MTFGRRTSPGFDWSGVTSALAAAWAFARRHPAVLWLATLLGTFLAGYVIAALILFPAPIFAADTVVPRVIGLDRETARAAIAEAGLTPDDGEEVTHPTAPRGTVVWQDPPPGVAVPERSAVTMDVSAGPQRVPVPDLAGYEQELARRLIDAAGLQVGRVERTQAPVPRDVVVNTRPPAGTPLLPQSPVTLVVSEGAPTITVPNLLGLSEFEARLALEEASLILGTTLMRTSPADVPGTIIAQSPAPGTLAAPGTAVHVTIARERNP